MDKVTDKSTTPERKATREGNFYPECSNEIGPGMNDRIRRLRKLSFETQPSLSIERALHETAFYKENFGKYSTPVLRALNFLDHCKKKTLYLGDDELIVGERGPAPKVVPTFPELTCHSVEDFNVLNTREQQRYTISEEDIATYASEVIPYWQGKTIRERIFGHVPAEWLAAYEAGLFTEVWTAGFTRKGCWISKSRSLQRSKHLTT
jgi:formate C-acetyltransferase